MKKSRKKNHVVVIAPSTALAIVETQQNDVIDTTCVETQAPTMTTQQIDEMLLDTAKSIGATQLAIVETQQNETRKHAKDSDAEYASMFDLNTRSYRIARLLRDCDEIALTKAEIVKRTNCTKIPRVFARAMQDTNRVKLYRQDNDYVYAMTHRLAK